MPECPADKITEIRLETKQFLVFWEKTLDDRDRVRRVEGRGYFQNRLHILTRYRCISLLCSQFIEQLFDPLSSTMLHLVCNVMQREVNSIIVTLLYTIEWTL